MEPLLHCVTFLLARKVLFRHEVDSESHDFIEDVAEVSETFEEDRQRKSSRNLLALKSTRRTSSFNDIEEGTLPASVINRENAGYEVVEIQEDWKG